MRRFLLPLIITLAVFSARAEYRVYRLLVTNTETRASRVVLSTLDPLQYPIYHPVGKNETLTLDATWMCWNRADYFTSYCPQPDTRQPAVAP